MKQPRLNLERLKKTLSLLALLLLLFEDTKSTPLYRIIKDNSFKFSNVYNTREKRLEFKKLINEIYKDDQTVRTKSVEYFKANVKEVDKRNYYKYRNFILKNGYHSVDYTDSNFYTNREMTKLIVRNYALQIHFSDFYGMDLLTIIQHSIQRRTCNEKDLMQYFVTYIWRRTQFDYAIPHIVAIPKLKDSTYINFSLNRYLQHCKKVDSTFSFTLIDNCEIRNSQLRWIDSKILKSSLNITIKKLLDSFLFRIFQKNIYEFIRICDPDFKFDGVKFMILFCTHPKTLASPTFPVK